MAVMSNALEFRDMMAHLDQNIALSEPAPNL